MTPDRLPVKLSPAARFDLLEIELDLEPKNPIAAERYLDLFVKAFALLERLPFAGHGREDLEWPGLRIWIVRPYLILYQVRERSIDVLHIVHGARDLPRLLQD